MPKDVCDKGTSCGDACINQMLSCDSRIDKSSAKALLGSIPKAAIKPYSIKQELGSGKYGTAVLTDRGTVVKTANPKRKIKPESFQDEYSALKTMYDLGLGPKPIGLDLDKLSIEMSMVEGSTLKSLGKAGQLTDALKIEAAKAFLVLHKAGWVHNDAHLDNVFSTSDGVKLIDGGMVRRFDDVSGGPAWRDVGSVLYGSSKHTELISMLRPHLTDFEQEIEQSESLKKKARDTAKKAAMVKLHSAYIVVATKVLT